MVESIFQCTVSEKHTFYRSKSDNRGRLQTCAEALRLALEQVAHKLRRKTLLAVIDHIVQTLPAPDGGYVEALLGNYVKALTVVLAHAPSVELLSRADSEGWFTSVDFVVQVVQQDLPAAGREIASARSSPAPGNGFSASLITSSTRSLVTLGRNKSGGTSHTTREALAECLVSLSQSPSAPVLERGQSLAYAAVQVLQHQSSLNRGHVYAFEAVNQILSLTSTEDADLANSLAPDVLPLIISYWRTKNASNNALVNMLRAEMLNTLLLLEPHLEYLVRHASEGSLCTLIDELADVLWEEYSHRQPNSTLELDHLQFRDGATDPSISPFAYRWFSLRPFSLDNESKWALVQILAQLESLTRRRPTIALESTEQEEHPRKRQRTLPGTSKLRQRLQAPDKTLQQVALQVLPFFASREKLEFDEIHELLSLLINLLGHKDTRLSSWAMVSCARLVEFCPVPPTEG